MTRSFTVLCFAGLAFPVAAFCQDKPIVRESRHKAAETTDFGYDILPAHRRETTYVGDKKQGECRGYDDKNRLIFNEFYVNGVLHGDQTRYFPNGKKATVMPYADGKNNGKSTAWYPDGTIANTIDWKDNKPHGAFTSYYPNGKKYLELNYRDGKQHGMTMCCSPEGKLAVEIEVKDGKLVSEKVLLRDLPNGFIDKWGLLAKPKSLREHWEEHLFVPIFNGKDLKGWHQDPKDKAKWEVKDGVLTGTGPVGHLYTDKDDYEDFHLVVEARINDRGNSGVYARAIPRANSPFPTGYEAQINSTHNDPIRTGSLHRGFNPKLNNAQVEMISIHEKLVKPDEWFTLDLIASGNKIAIRVNGVYTVEYTDDDKISMKGAIALQQHHKGSVVEFRKIAIRVDP